MGKYLVLFREPDGREGHHPDDAVKVHQQQWKDWLAHWGRQGKLAGGSGLTLQGRIMHGPGAWSDGIHRSGKEIIGGFLLLNADDLEEATAMLANCPVFAFGGYAEIREMQGGA